MVAIATPPRLLPSTSADARHGRRQHRLQETVVAVLDDRDRREDRREQQRQHDDARIEVLQVADAGAAARAEAAGEAGAQHRPQDQRLRGGADDAARLPEEAAQVAPRERGDGPHHDDSPLPVSFANTSASVGRLVAMAAIRPGGNSSAMRGTTS